MIDLSAAPIFAGLSPVELARLVPELEVRSIPAGGVVFRLGEEGDCLFVVRSGVAEARAGTGDEGEYPLAVFEPGESFGEMALLTDEPRSTTIVAVTDLELWALPKERFHALVQQTPNLALTVGRLLSRRLQATNQAVSSMHHAFDTAAERSYYELDKELQEFLWRTSPLNPVFPELAARAVGRPDADQVLAYLVARLPFVSQEPSGAYRYHKLFRELLDDKLTTELGQDGRQAWLLHLAECARELGVSEQALVLSAEAGQLEDAEALAVTQARAMLESGDLDGLDNFLASLPHTITHSGGELADLRAELLLGRGQVPEALVVLEDAVRLADSDLVDGSDGRFVKRYRRLAELSFQLGRSNDGIRWLRRADEDEADPSGSVETGDHEPIGPLVRDGRDGGALPSGLMALASLSGLRRASSSAGALGGRGSSRPLGVGLSIGLLVLFLMSPPPSGLSREGYLALGVLAAALPLLVFSVLSDHLVALLLVLGWAGFGLVPARVALSGFATPGWLLVLSVLAVGVALGRSGLLYRLVLALLARVPSHHHLLMLALAGVGVVFSTAMPNATARTALAAPLTLEISDALGYAHRSRGSAAIAMAALLGFGQMCSLFLTGSSSGLLVHSLLPEESRARFGWVNWFVAALPLHLVIFVLSYLAIIVLLRPDRPKVRKLAIVQAQRQILGPLTRGERIGACVFVLLVLAFIVSPSFGIDPAWPAVLAMITLGATRVLDEQAFRSGINWTFLIFFGVILSLAEVFSTLKVDTWLASAASQPLAPLAANPALFLVAAALAGYVLNLVVRWQAACVLMSLVLVPAVAPFGIEPWVVGMTALVTTNMWFLPYQSTIYQALYYGSDEQAFSHAQARPMALAYGAACLVGLVATVPIWQRMGLLP